jgi:hypothetical protein
MILAERTHGIFAVVTETVFVVLPVEGQPAALTGDVAQWAMIVLTAYFGGRSIEKVARILSRK